MTQIRNRPAEARPASFEVLPDGRRRLTRYRTLASLSAVNDTLILPWGTPDAAPADTAHGTAGFSGLRLVDQKIGEPGTVQGVSQSAVLWIEVYEQIPAAAELQVGRPTRIRLEDGREALESEYLQFADAAFVPGVVGVAVSADDPLAYLQKVEAVNDGCLRKIKRTYVWSGILEVVTETRNKGALVVQTVTSIGAAPTAPAGYSIVRVNQKNPSGLSLYTSVFARGLGRVETETQQKQNGKLLLTTIRYLDSDSEATPAGVPTASAERPDDGHTVYVKTFSVVVGDGVVFSTREDRNSGRLVVYRTQRLGAVPAKPLPTIGGTVVAIKEDSRAEDGFTLYDYTWAEGMGLALETITLREGGLRVCRWISLGERLCPVGVVLIDEKEETEGTTRYTVAALQTSGGGYPSSDAVSSISITNAGSGYTSAPSVAFIGGGGSGAAGVAVLAGTTLATIQLTNAGSGYTSAPAVRITGGGGSGAAATAHLSGSSLASVSLESGGDGYTTAPSVTITGGSGTGAEVTASLAAAGVSGVDLLTAGSGYTSVPSVVFTGGGGTGAAATVNVVSGRVSAIALTNVGSGYTSEPVVTLVGGGGAGARARAVLAPAPSALGSVVLQNGGAGYFCSPTVTASGGGGSGATIIASLDRDVGLKGVRIDNGGIRFNSRTWHEVLLTVNKWQCETVSGNQAFLNPRVEPNVAALPSTLAAGSGFVSPVDVFFDPPILSCSGCNAYAVVSGGTIASVVVLNPGKGFSANVPSVISIYGRENSGTGAVLTCQITDGAISSVAVVDGGTGYLGDFAIVEITQNAGPVAEAVPVVTDGVITSVTVTNQGYGYTSTPGCAAFDYPGNAGSGAVLQANVVSGRVVSVTVVSGGSGYSGGAGTLVRFAGGGVGATASPNLSGGTVPSINLSPNDQKIYGGWGRFYVVEGGTRKGHYGVFNIPETSKLAAYAGGYRLAYGASRIWAQPGDTITAAVSISESGFVGVPILDSRPISGLTIANAGSGYLTPPSLSFSANAGGTGAAATALLGASGINSISITSGGSGYTSSPAISFSGGGGSGAAATAVISGGAVVAINITATGSGYSSTPTISFSGGAGTGAAATASVATGSATTLQSIVVEDGGGGYLGAPAVTITGGGGTGATATASITPLQLAGITVTAPGAGYTSAPSVEISGGGGSGATATARLPARPVGALAIVAYGTGYTSAPVISFMGGGGTGAAATAQIDPVALDSVTVTAPGSGYTSAPVISFDGGGGSGAVGQAVLAPTSLAGVSITSAGSGYSSAPSVEFSGGSGTGAAATASRASGSLLIDDVDTRNNGKLKLYRRISTIGEPSAPAAMIGGSVVLVSTSRRSEAGYDLVDYRWAEGNGTIFDRTEKKYNGRIELRTITFIGAPTTAPSGTKIQDETRDDDGYGLVTQTWVSIPAIGGAETGLILDTEEPKSGGKLWVYRKTRIGAAPSTPAGHGGTVSLIEGRTLQRDEGTEYAYTWVEGSGVYQKSTSPRDGGLKVETWVSYGAAFDAATMVPGGIQLTQDSESVDGTQRFVVSSMQKTDGTSPTAGTALQLGVYHPFEYPGRAKVITTVVNSTYHSYDVYLSPPITVDVLATATVTYQTSNEIGALAAPKWAPEEWAVLTAKYIAHHAYPKVRIEGLRGYRSVDDTPITFNGGSTTGQLETCLGERVYGIGTGTPYSIAVSGGPEEPDENTYTLFAKVEEAFQSYTGTKYYRRTVIAATIPAQPALPV